MHLVYNPLFEFPKLRSNVVVPGWKQTLIRVYLVGEQQIISHSSIIPSSDNDIYRIPFGSFSVSIKYRLVTYVSTLTRVTFRTDMLVHRPLSTRRIVFLVLTKDYRWTVSQRLITLNTKSKLKSESVKCHVNVWTTWSVIYCSFRHVMISQLVRLLMV